MANKLNPKPPTKRDQADHVRLRHAGDPAHINADEARLLSKLMPEAAGPVVTRGLLAEAGRYGDDRVTRLIPAEAALLKSRGGAGTRNPMTGLLEYSTAGGGGGEGGDNGVGGPGNGSEGTGPGQDYGGGGFGADGTISGGFGRDSYSSTFNDNFTDTGYGYNSVDPSHAKPSIANMTLDQISSVLKDTWDTIDEDRHGYFGPNKPVRDDGWYSPDTFGRFFQEMWAGPALSEPGRYGAPTKAGPGLFGGFLSQITPSLMGMPAFSAAMRTGGAMGRASSQATQEASAKEDAARSGHNSNGQQQSHSVQAMDAALAKYRPAGEQSGAATAAAPQVPPGYAMNPAGQVVPMQQQGGDNREAWKDPVQNLLYDYIWRGRTGSGFGW